MSSFLSLFLFGKAKIIAVKTGLVLHVTGDQVIELTPTEVDNLAKAEYYPNEFKGACRDLFLGKVKEQFIASLRADPELRRRIGGTKWEARLLNDKDVVSAHTSRPAIETYYRELVNAYHRGTPEADVVSKNITTILEQLEALYHAM